MGLEFDWLGCDEVGHVALFSTAGAGHAPAVFLRNTAAHDAAIDMVLGLPASTTAKFYPTLPPGTINTWRLVAERGLYAFDCDPNGGPYRLVAEPITPVKLDKLPVSVTDLASQTRVKSRFGDRQIISDDMLSILDSDC